MLNTAVIGGGYWGANIVRVLSKTSNLKYICDLDKHLLRRKYEKEFPHAELLEDSQYVFLDKNIDAVFIATPPASHCGLATQALTAGKHVFIEKPMTVTEKESKSIIKLAKKKDLKIAVGHVFLYSSPVREVKRILDEGTLGEILHVSMTRQNLGRFQLHCDAIYDLAPHDLSMLLYWFPEFDIDEARVTLFHHFKKLQPDTAYVGILSKKDGPTVSLSYSWIFPHKIRNVVIVGDKKSIVYDDTNITTPVQVFDKGVEITTDTFGDFICSYRTGDIYSPYIPIKEPLLLEIEAFLDHIEYGDEIINTAQNGLEVVRLLELIKSSASLLGE
jgi:predicted dehydrogenase